MTVLRLEDLEAEYAKAKAEWSKVNAAAQADTERLLADPQGYDSREGNRLRAERLIWRARIEFLLDILALVQSKRCVGAEVVTHYSSEGLCLQRLQTCGNRWAYGMTTKLRRCRVSTSAEPFELELPLTLCAWCEDALAKGKKIMLPVLYPVGRRGARLYGDVLVGRTWCCGDLHDGGLAPIYVEANKEGELK